MAIKVNINTNFSWPKPGEIGARADGAMSSAIDSTAQDLLPGLEMALKSSYIKLGGPVHTGTLLSTVGAEQTKTAGGVFKAGVAETMVTWGYLDSRLYTTINQGRPAHLYVQSIEAGAQQQNIPPNIRIAMWMEFRGLPPEALESVKRSIAFNLAPPAPGIHLIEAFQRDSAYMAVVETAGIRIAEEFLQKAVKQVQGTMGVS